MAEVKWLKLMVDMFDNRKIKYLRKLPDGNSIVLIWVMLLTMAAKCNAGGMIYLTQDIPYNSKLLSDELDFEESTIQLALSALSNLNMIIINEDEFRIAGWEKYQNIDGMERLKEQRKEINARYYQKKKLLSDDFKTSCKTSLRVESDSTEEDKDIDKDVDNPPKSPRGFEEWWSEYPKKVGKQAAKKSYEKALKLTTPDALVSAVRKQKGSSQWTKDNGQYIPNPATWLNQGRWDDELMQASESAPENARDTVSLDELRAFTERI